MPVLTDKRNFLSPKIEYDAELEHYRPNLEQEIKEVLADMRHNEMMFNLEIEPDLVEQRIYERQALRCRYRFLIGEARRMGLNAILTEHA